MEPLDFCQCRTKGPIMQAPAGSVFHPGTVCGKCMHPREPAKLPEDPETMVPVAVATVEPAGTFRFTAADLRDAVKTAGAEIPVDGVEVPKGVDIDATGRAFAEIADERFRQEVLRSQGRFPYTCASKDLGDLEKFVILSEEVGELARAVVEVEKLANDTHHADARDAMRKELVQIAAVAVAWLESL